MTRSTRLRRRAVVLLVVLGVIATACGARVPGPVRREAAGAVLSPPAADGGQVDGGSAQGGLTGSGGSNPTGNGQTLSGGSTGSAGIRGTNGTQGTGGSQGGSANAKVGVKAGSAATRCGNGTDVGLTANTISLGTVATLTGPVSGLFQGAVQGAESFANYINNASDGLCGRRVSVDAADDGTNCAQNQNVTNSLIGKTFALVGSFSLYDGCGATVIRQHPTVPDVHLALDPAAETPPNHFDISAGESGYATGMFHYYAQKYGSKVQHVGTIVENIPSALANQANMVHSAESQGWKFTISITESPTTSNFENDFFKMCQQSHIQVFFLLTEPAQSAATMMRNEREAGCHGLINIVPIAYDQAFIADYGSPVSDLNGIEGWNEYALFFNKDEAAHIPEVKLLQQWFAHSYPGKPLNLYAMYAWADERLFQEGFERAGKTTNRRTVSAALHTIKNFSANGLISPRNPGQRPGVHCYILWQLQNGTFSRVDDPRSGYRCDGKFLPR